MPIFPLPGPLKPSDKNKLNHYLPIRNKNNNFSWETITGVVLSHALKSEIRDYGYLDFQADCRARFLNKLDSSEFWDVLNRTYFVNCEIFNVSPMFLLFKAQRTKTGVKSWDTQDQRMAELFMSMMGNHFSRNKIDEKLNFIEAEMLAVLSSKLKKSQPSTLDETCYLPFLAEAFVRDLTFLEAHPQYLLQELANTLKLYAFSYMSQLALNIKSWPSGEPRSKPLYFILDTEKASAERTHVSQHGYKLLSSSTEALFPLLSSLEALQTGQYVRPLWKIYQEAEAYYQPQRILNDMNQYLQEFIKLRALPARPPAETIKEVFQQFESVAIEQFKDNKTTRAGVNRKYVLECERQVLSGFIQSRGRAGKVLVIKQDQLLLLTNLAIGQRDKLRLHELIEEFKTRGFYFDGQSQQQLVQFFERMGNVERMSDSGDAVYVRRTV